MRTVKKDTEMAIIIHLLVRSEICRMSSLHYPIPSTHILTLRYPPSPLTLTNPLSPSHCLLNKHKLLVDHLPACRRLLFPLLHAEKPLSACNKGNRRRLHVGKLIIGMGGFRGAPLKRAALPPSPIFLEVFNCISFKEFSVKYRVTILLAKTFWLPSPPPPTS